MKSFVIFVFAAICAVAMCTPQSEMEENSRECAQKHNVPVDEIKMLLAGEIQPDSITGNMKCYFLCMSVKDGFFKDGSFQIQVFAEKTTNSTNKDAVAKAVVDCKDVKGTDNCDSAFRILICLYEHIARI